MGVDQFVCLSQNGKCWKCTGRGNQLWWYPLHNTAAGYRWTDCTESAHVQPEEGEFGTWLMSEAHTCSIEEHHAVLWSTTAVANCNITYYVNWTQAFNLTTVHSCTYACRTVFLCLLCPSPLHLSCSQIIILCKRKVQSNIHNQLYIVEQGTLV